MSWPLAQAACVAMGAHLAEPLSMQENIFIKGLVIEHGVSGVWLGAEDMASEGHWYWSKSGASVADFTDWAPGEPNDDHDQDCMWYKASVHQWDDAQCDTEIPFICQEFSTDEIVG